jgi:DNA replication and repair protein RecF
MQLQNIQLINFKNLEKVQVSCDAKINCLIGKNGSGKTNFLDAIYYLSATKSAFNAIDSQNIKDGENFFSIIANIENDEKKIKVKCNLEIGQKKNFVWHGEQYEKLSDHIGRFPAVLITPYDTDLVREGSESRRKYFDMMISQCEKPYLQALIRYNHSLKQRNALLKNIASSNRWQQSLLDPYDTELITLGKFIGAKRRDFSGSFTKICEDYYQKLSDHSEMVTLEYRTEALGDDFDKKFKAQRREDLKYQRTTMGIHKDDYVFSINEKQLKRFGSQGQQKSFVISFKLAHYKTLENQLSIQPILLLDDIFEKLDDQRIEILISMVNSGAFGQIFITDARLERTKSILSATENVKFYSVESGTVEVIAE